MPNTQDMYLLVNSKSKVTCPHIKVIKCLIYFSFTIAMISNRIGTLGSILAQQIKVCLVFKKNNSTTGLTNGIYIFFLIKDHTLCIAIHILYLVQMSLY